HISIKGIGFRFIDTAGIRETSDVVEKIGIARTFDKIEKARLIIYLFEGSDFDIGELQQIQERFPNKQILPICNKMDLLDQDQLDGIRAGVPQVLFLSAKHKKGIEELEGKLLDLVDSGALSGDTTIISNSRHYD